jgi:uncharacterized protein YegP (UPF0339 family)
MEKENDFSEDFLCSADQFLECDDYKGDNGFFKFTKENKFYFALNFSGKTYLRSQNYSLEIARDNGINSVYRNAFLDERWLTSKTLDNKFYYYLIAGNKHEVARSCYYNSKEEMENDLNWIRSENSIIGIGATEIEGKWYSAVELLSKKKINFEENQIEEFNSIPKNYNEELNIPLEKSLDNLEKDFNSFPIEEIKKRTQDKNANFRNLLWITIIAAMIVLSFIYFKK